MIGQTYSFFLLSPIFGLPLNVTTGVTSLIKATKTRSFLYLHSVVRTLVPLGLTTTIKSHLILYHVSSLYLGRLKVDI